MRESSILEAARALFIENGPDSTSIEDIVHKSGVAKGTFYHYFKDKSELISQIRHNYLKQVVNIAADKMGEHEESDWHSRLNTWIEVLATELLGPYTVYYDFFYNRPSCHRIPLSEEPIVQQLADLLDKGSNEAIWTVDQPIPTAICMVHSLHGLVDNARTTRTPATEIVPFLYRLFLKILSHDNHCKSGK